MDFFKATYGYKKKVDDKWLVLGEMNRTMIIIAEDYSEAVNKVKNCIDSLNFKLDTEKFTFYQYGTIEKLIGLYVDYNTTDGMPVIEGIKNRII